MAVEKRRNKTAWQNLTLKEKYKQHWQTRKFQPSDRAVTLFGMSFVWVNMSSLVIEGLTLLLPHYFMGNGDKESAGSTKSQTTGLFLSVVATLYLLVGTACHWWFLRNENADKVCKSTSNGLDRHSEPPEGWRFCTECGLHCPPRSHHCSLCNVCILKRDHHCFFSGSCVGFHNQRHFIMFLIYALSASAYGVFMQWAYLKSEEGYGYFFPLVAIWKTLSRKSYAFHLVLLFHLYLGIIITATSVGFISWQIRIILRGQTSYEAVKGLTEYAKLTRLSNGDSDKGTRPSTCTSASVVAWRYRNFVSACGTPLEFMLCLLVPVARTKLPGDGIHWDVI